jgi:hypothetical protein
MTKTRRTYGAGHIAKRHRRSPDDMADVRAAILDVLKADRPQTVRQVFYQLVTRGVVEKSEGEYNRTVSRLLGEMRLAGQVPWDWIGDESRRTIVTETFDNISDAIADTAKFYRRSALRECPDHIEIWCEKEALSGIIYEAASHYDVPVIPSKGMPSLTQIFGRFCAIQRAANAGKDGYVYQFGDHDPTGCLIPEVMERRLYEFCERYDCKPPHVERVALTAQQIEHYRLPMRPTKREGNPHAHRFVGDSVELDALPSHVLRTLVRDCIERHIDQTALDTLREAEASERDLLRQFAAQVEDEQ